MHRAGSGTETGLNLIVLLDDGAAVTPKGGAAVAKAASGDAKTLADLGALEHGVDPVEAREEAEAAVDHAVVVEIRGRLHGWITETFRGLTDDYIWKD